MVNEYEIKKQICDIGRRIYNRISYRARLGGRKKKDAVLCASDDEVRCREGTDDKSIIKFRLK